MANVPPSNDQKRHGLREAKEALLDAVSNTRRGSSTSLEERGLIEELQVAVESYQGADELDYSLLGGLWELKYTTADDVVPIIQAEEVLRPPLFGLPSPVQIGLIKQRFTSPVDGEGKVDNIIEFGLPFLLEDKKGFTFTVNASYEVRSGHRICIVFDKASVSDVRISEGLEALLTPALLPRNPLQHAALMAIKQFKLEFPFRTARQVASGVAARTGVTMSDGGSYQITYLDKDLQVGRSTFASGIFILTRIQEEPAQKQQEEVEEVVAKPANPSDAKPVHNGVKQTENVTA